jgi:hypothetical protein
VLSTTAASATMARRRACTCPGVRLPGTLRARIMTLVKSGSNGNGHWMPNQYRPYWAYETIGNAKRRRQPEAKHHSQCPVEMT